MTGAAELLLDSPAARPCLHPRASRPVDNQSPPAPFVHRLSTGCGQTTWRNQLAAQHSSPTVGRQKDCPMPWFQVDDGLASHPKVTKLKRGATRERAMGLWVLAGSWSARYLTEGQIPREQIDELGCTMTAASWLLGNRMWHEAGHDCDECPQPATDDGFVYHDWTQANRTMQEVLDKRAARSAAGSKGGKASGERRRAGSKPEANASPIVQADASTTVERNRSNGGEPLSWPVLAYPNPLASDEAREGPSRPAALAAKPTRGTRLPDGWLPDEALKAWTRAHHPGLGLAEVEKFHDYWRSVAGQRGVRIDWDAVWRNWCRRSDGFGEDRPNGSTPHGVSPNDPVWGKTLGGGA